MKILYTTPVLLHPPAGGPALRVENSIKALNKISELHIISRVKIETMGGHGAITFYRKYCKNIIFSPSASARPLIHRLIDKVCFIFFKIRPLKDKRKCKDKDFIINYARNNSISVLWFGYGNISYEIMKDIKEKAPELKIICDTDSVWSRFILRELPYESDSSRKIKIKNEGKLKVKEEAEWVNFCDITTAVSNVDAEYYKSLSNYSERIKIFSNVIDLETYKNKVPPPEKFKKPCIYIAGTFWKNSPMEKAARWVIEKIFPIIKDKLPGVHLYIIGQHSDKVLSDINDSAITITGMIDSVLPYLCNVDVSLVPLTFESGTRYKILEAAACGIPIVSTTLGAEGIPIKDEYNILIADEANTFAEAIIRIIKNKNLAITLSKNCKDLIQKKYSINSLTKEAKVIINYLNVIK